MQNITEILATILELTTLNLALEDELAARISTILIPDVPTPIAAAAPDAGTATPSPLAQQLEEIRSRLVQMASKKESIMARTNL